MQITFHIEEVIDQSCGVPEYIARRNEDFDSEGLPKQGTPSARADSEWEAIAKLCAIIFDRECV